MFKPLALLISSFIILLPNVWASAATQYHLDVTKQASFAIVGSSTLFTWKGRVATRISGYRKIEWKSLMSQCLPLVCSSAPDVAYATEYGESFCKRAGIDNVVIQLPKSYLEGANGTYFTSEGYLESRAVGELSINKAMMGGAILAALSFFVL
ncbi:hypothetical protein I352_00477 [Cryptococcus deuterogattii MMRL2647]|nr:hypothetical protein I352_00477 [Cryptococcus deuterogattii MMRL2647]